MVTSQDSSGSLCNGQWKTVTLSKTPSQISINVLTAATQVTTVNTGNLDIVSELFVGGIAEQSDTALILNNAGITTQSGWYIYIK